MGTIASRRGGARVYRQKNEAKILAEYAEFLRIPNVSSDRLNVRRNAEHIAAMLRQPWCAVRVD